MAKLGEAYIQVRADLKPFDKDLDRGVDNLIKRFERDLNKQFGKRLGTNLGGGFREGISESLAGAGKDIDNSLSVPANNAGRNAGKRFKKGLSDEVSDAGFIQKAFAALVSGLEDGFSALPVQVKAAVGAALVAAIAPAGALAAAALGVALIGAVDAAGIALAFQFEEVQLRGQRFTTDLRERFVNAAESFGSATINAMDLLDFHLERLDGTLRNLFDNASEYVLPFTEGLSRTLEGIINGLDAGIQAADFTGLTREIVTGFERVGSAIGDAFELILSNQDLDVALGDLFELIADLVDIGGEFLNWAVDTYTTLRPVITVVKETAEVVIDLVDALVALSKLAHEDADIVGEFAQVVDFLGTAGEKTIRPFTGAGNAMSKFNREVGLTIAATDEETKALNEMRRAFDALTSAAKNSIDSEVEYRSAILATRGHLDEYGASLNNNKQSGLDLIAVYEEQITKLSEFVNAQVTTGAMTDAEAKKYYDKEIARIRSEHKERGGNIAQFDAIFAKYIQLAGLPPIPSKTDPLTWAARTADDAVNNLIESLKRAAKTPPLSGNIKVSGGTQLFADGGLVTSPTSAILGENYRPELVLPLTQPNRSMSLLANSPLAGAMGGGTTVIAVFDGEPFQARIVRTANSINRKNARTINHVPRSL